jgi:hypothetical protein
MNKEQHFNPQTSTPLALHFENCFIVINLLIVYISDVLSMLSTPSLTVKFDKCSSERTKKGDRSFFGFILILLIDEIGIYKKNVEGFYAL